MSLNIQLITFVFGHHFFIFQHLIPISLECPFEDLHPLCILLALLFGLLLHCFGLAAVLTLLGECKLFRQLKLYLVLGDLLKEDIECSHKLVHLCIVFLTNCLVVLAGVLINLNIIIDIDRQIKA